jgi:hypothetical protein
MQRRAVVHRLFRDGTWLNLGLRSNFWVVFWFSLLIISDQVRAL